MLRLSFFLSIGIILILAAGTAVAATVPVPGVGVVIKKWCGEPPRLCNPNLRFGAPDLPALSVDFFGPGSDPFEGQVGLQGPCELPCNPCNCDDLRIDYAMDSPAGPFESSLVPMTLHSTAPIAVGNASGVDSFFDVWVELLPPSGSQTVSGSLSIEPGTTLLPGTSSFVVDSFFDIEYRITFTEAGTENPAGQAITGSLRLDLQESNLPISCLDDGSTTGVFVLGQGGSGVQSFTHVSSGGGLELTLESIADSVVGSDHLNWGTAKSLFR